MELPQEPIPGEGGVPPVAPEQPVGFWAKLWSAIKGF